MATHANWFAYLALLSWPLVTLWLFRSYPLDKAVVWTILGAYLLLPVGTLAKIEMIPNFNKVTVPNITAFILYLLVRRHPRPFRNRFGLAEVLILMYLLGPLVSSELNTDALTVGEKTLEGAGTYEGFSAVRDQFIILIPFILGRQVLWSSADNEKILRVLVIAGLLYSLPMLFEIRMSPQLHTWIYGYFPNNQFSQNMRSGGFRPVVFMDNGLMVAFFTMSSAVAATALSRTRLRVIRVAPGGVTAYLSVMLILCKTAASLLYGALLIPLVRFAKPRLQVRVAVVLAIGALVYPALRAEGFIPTTFMLDTAASFSAERAASLGSRFREEEELFEHASQRPLFGWGRLGRARIYDQKTGEDISTTDGYWISVMGDFGWFGFFATFGLLALPVFRVASAISSIDSMHERIFLAALALIVAVSIVDLIPNAFLTPWNWLLAGALLGRTEMLRTAPGRELSPSSSAVPVGRPPADPHNARAWR
jgi:hypothetical protein